MGVENIYTRIIIVFSSCVADFVAERIINSLETFTTRLIIITYDYSIVKKFLRFSLLI